MTDSRFHRDGAFDDDTLQPLLDWSDLLTAENPTDLLVGLGQAMRPYVAELALKQFDGDVGETIAGWRGGPASTNPPHQVEIGGLPHWRLSIRLSENAPQMVLVERALMAVEAWRSARQGLADAQDRVDARTRELDLIQALGRGVAEARDLDTLFRCAIELLQSAEDIDVAVAAYAVGRRRTVLSMESRPLDDDTRTALAGQAIQLLGWADDDRPATRVDHLSGYDDTRGTLVEWDESSLVVLPVLRGERIAACLTLLPSRPAGEGALRLCYSVANQLSLHLDRILTVHEAEADRFRAILDSMPQAVLLLDGQLHVQQANPAAIEMFAKLDMPLVGSIEAVLRSLGMFEATDRVRCGERNCESCEIRYEDDRTFSLSVARLNEDRSNEPDMVLVIGDISEARQMQLQLAQADKMSSLGRMISGVTHELNNPLTSIMGYSQLLRAAVPEGKVAERAERLESEARRCQKIVKNLLSFARRREVKHGSVSLNEVVESVLALMGYQMRIDGVTVETDLSPDLPAVVGDHHHLQQVLVNLLTNARQAIRSDAQSGKIIVRTRLHGGEAVIEVEDDGPGIPEALRSRIFDPFFTTKPEGQGTGLGLALVYGIVRDHAGTIEALKEARDGACFRVTLPLPERPRRTAEEPEAELPEVEVGPATVLVVDDEEPVAQMICESLREDGHTATCAHDAESALEAAQERSFDLVIADLRMPGVGGEALFELLTERHPRLAERLLLTTGDTAGDAIERAGARTGCEVLAKPFDVDALHRAVRKQLIISPDERDRSEP
ncbi:MAG: response regulator [Acidobacteria bacterium]|nr:response regulator [Acidobacteriota bacterium]NIM63576.1 response regulator [Acidobacteriota bacterium]NIO58438.1 response regulator [Acidobacteriota bacterium]NIQ29493.1 response regulator [Acidobacteriota bacterium]NIQ84170.1 response regulator [Acidobacteriota bacterium]